MSRHGVRALLVFGSKGEPLIGSADFILPGGAEREARAGDQMPRTPEEGSNPSPTAKSMTSNYTHSFLICFHTHHAEVFSNGLPLGRVTGGCEFEPHMLERVHGTGYPAELPEKLMAEVSRVVARTIVEMRERQLGEAIQAIPLPQEKAQS